MEEKKKNSDYEACEALLYKKTEELIESLTDEEKEKLEAQGIELDLEEVFRLLCEHLNLHFDSAEFSIEHLKEDLKHLTKKDIFGL